MISTHLPNGPLADRGPGFPVQAAADRQSDSQQWTLEVTGRSTEFLATAYSDRIMLVASNTGTFGTIMQARCASQNFQKSPLNAEYVGTCAGVTHPFTWTPSHHWEG